jgi:hypothetical protein
MPKRVKKPVPKRLPSDINQLARALVEQTTQEPKPFKEQLSDYMRRLGRRGGKKSGQTRKEWLSKDERVRIASLAARARWAKRKRDGES